MTATSKKPPIRVVHEDGEPVALVRARSEAAAIRHVTKKKYEAPIADQDHLLALAPKFAVEDAGAEEAS